MAVALGMAWFAPERRGHRLMMADYHGALQVEAQTLADGARRHADILDGKVDDPIRPFLNPGDTRSIRAEAALNDSRASTHAGLRADYLRGADRLWELEPRSPAF